MFPEIVYCVVVKAAHSINVAPPSEMRVCPEFLASYP